MAKQVKEFYIKRNGQNGKTTFIKGTMEYLKDYFSCVRENTRGIKSLVNQVQADYSDREKCCYQRTYFDVATKEEYDEWYAESKKPAHAPACVDKDDE